MSMFFADAPEMLTLSAPCPWRRYAARWLDLLIYGLLWNAIARCIFRLNLGSGFYANWLFTLVDTAVGVLLMLLIEPVLLHFWGTTPGKWLFGLRVRAENGEKIAYRTAFARTWLVYTDGMGWYLPLWIIYKLWKNYQLCQREEMPWDEENGCRIVMREAKMKWYRVPAFILAAALVYGASFGVGLHASLPHNRGRMTLSQYVDNCNDMQRYHQWGRIVRPDGTLGEDSSTEGMVITLQNARKEQPVCTVETDADGYVTAVEMHVEMDVEAVGYVPATDVKTMMLYAYGLPHEKLSLLSLNSDITSNRDSYTRNLGSLTVTQKIEMTRTTARVIFSCRRTKMRRTRTLPRPSVLKKHEKTGTLGAVRRVRTALFICADENLSDKTGNLSKNDDAICHVLLYNKTIIGKSGR